MAMLDAASTPVKLELGTFGALEKYKKAQYSANSSFASADFAKIREHIMPDFAKSGNIKFNTGARTQADYPNSTKEFTVDGTKDLA